MAYYLTQAAYTPEAWAAQIKNPRDPLERLRPVVEKLGGSIVGFWYAFGECDVVAIVQYPDNVSVAAASLVVSAGGAAKAMKTTPLMTIEEGLEAMKKAAESGYQPPGS